MKSEKGNLGIAIAIVIAGILVAGALMLGNKNTDQNNGPVNQDNGVNNPSAQISIESISDSDHIRGDINAPIKIVEYSDTECPFCLRYHQTMKQILTDYDGQIAWVYRHFPIPQLHPRAISEAHATECVAEIGGEEKFWEYLDRVYESKPTTLDVAQLAEDIGIDREAFQACQESGKYNEKIQKQTQDAAKAGGRGTPHSVIVTQDGTLIPVEGAQPIASIKSVIDQLLTQE